MIIRTPVLAGLPYSFLSASWNSGRAVALDLHGREGNQTWGRCDGPDHARGRARRCLARPYHCRRHVGLTNAVRPAVTAPSAALLSALAAAGAGTRAGPTATEEERPWACSRKTSRPWMTCSSIRC